MRSVILYTLSNISSKLIAGVSGIFLARYFSKGDYGILTATLALTNFMVLISKFGTHDYLLYRFSQLKDEIEKRLLFSKVSLISIISYIVFFPITLFIYHFSITPIHQLSLSPITPIYLKVLFDAVLFTIFYAVLQNQNRFNILSASIIYISFIPVLSVLFAYIFQFSLKDYLFIHLIITTTFFAIWIIVVTRITSLTPLENLKNNIRDILNFTPGLLKSSYHFFISNFMVFLYMQSDIVMLSFLKEPVDVARYSIVVSLIFAAYMIPSSIYNYFIPKLINSFSIGSESKFLLTIKEFINLIVPVMFLFSLILFFFSYDILDILYAGKYNTSSNILRILSIVLFFHSVCFITGAVLTASKNQKIRSNIQALGAGFNIIANLIFIPKYGAEGAALTTAMTEAIIFILYIIYSFKAVKNRVCQ